MARKGLGKGLDSLIPNIFDENFDSNSAQSLEDMLNDQEETVEEVLDDIESQEEEPQEDETEEEVKEVKEESSEEDDVREETPEEKPEEESQDAGEPSESLSGVENSREAVQAPQKVQIQEEHVEEVKEIVDKNPRITLWSSRSSAVLRYLRKTEPEFSISKEASVLIEDAVAKKYPEIWALFEDL